MRSQVHTEKAFFRVSPELLARAELKAREQGMSVSELMRHALRREVLEAN